MGIFDWLFGKKKEEKLGYEWEYKSEREIRKNQHVDFEVKHGKMGVSQKFINNNDLSKNIQYLLPITNNKKFGVILTLDEEIYWSSNIFKQYYEIIDSDLSNFEFEFDSLNNLELFKLSNSNVNTLNNNEGVFLRVWKHNNINDPNSVKYELLNKKIGCTIGGIKSSQKIGLWVEYHENSKLKSVSFYKKNGLQHGSTILWNENGDIIEVENMTVFVDEDGNLPGIDMTDMLNDSINDKKEIQKLYHENGKIKQEFYVVNGQIEGLVKVYNEKGNLIEKGDFFNNKEQGNWEFYHENGKLKQKGNFKDGKHIGPWKFYHENGKIKQEGNYNENDRFEGTWKLYYPSGKLEQEIFYSDGIENGIYKDYYENGQLQKELLMENGKQVSIVGLYDESGEKIISKTDLE